MPTHRWACAFLAALAVAVLPAGAAAQDVVVSNKNVVRTILNKRVEVNIHGHAPSPAMESEMAIGGAEPEPLPAATDPPPADEVTPSPTFCGPENGADDVADALSTEPRMKVAYAYPADGTDNFALYADMIAREIAAASTTYRNDLGRGLRFDYGTTAGPGCLDIQTIQLPKTKAQYLAVSDINRFTQVANDADAILNSGAHGSGEVNHVIFADDLFRSGWSVGQGERFRDDSVAGTEQQLGGRDAVLWGDSGTYFLGGSTDESYTRHVVMHEIGHLLGAVQDSAPHSTGAAHCNDQYDLMCYSDGGPTSHPFVAPGCNGNVPIDQWPIDCNHDDYANPDPAPGSYLATHWNIVNSDFTCTVCLPRPVTSPPPPDPPVVTQPPPVTDPPVVTEPEVVTEPPVVTQPQATTAPPTTTPAVTSTEPPARPSLVLEKPALPAVAVSSPLATSRGALSLAVTCDCTGTLKITPKTSKSTETVHFVIHGSGLVKIRLTAPLRRLLGRTGRLKVSVRAVFVDATTSKRTTMTRKATLTGPRARKT